MKTRKQKTGISKFWQSSDFFQKLYYFSFFVLMLNSILLNYMHLKNICIYSKYGKQNFVDVKDSLQSPEIFLSFESQTLKTSNI